MKITVESWVPEYGAPFYSGELEASEGPPDLEVELAVDKWGPVFPPPDTPKAELIQFVDGVRRIKARVWITGDDGITRMGICASYAADVVQCGERAKLTDAEVRRTLVSTAGAPALDTQAGRFEPYAVADDGIQRLVNGMQWQMGHWEVENRP